MAQSFPILVVDDSPLIRALVEAQLRFLGQESECVADGAEALSRAKSKTYSLILLDIDMPGMTGIETARLFRAFEHLNGAHTPVVGFTAHYSQKALCLAAGMDDFLTKPALLQDLRTTLSRWLGKSIL